MLRLGFSSFLAAALFVVVIPAFAASGSSLASGSGSVASGTVIAPPPDPAALALEHDRRRRIGGFTEFFTKTSKPKTTFDAQMADYNKKRAANRERCREDLRRSNKDEQLGTLLNCMRADLTLDRELNHETRSYLEQIPGIAADWKTEYLKSIDDLGEALNSFVTAIDKSVFDSSDSLLEAKKNLYTNYRAPVADTMTLIQVDRSLYWTSNLLDLVEKNRIDQQAATGQDLEWWASLDTCLEHGDGLLRQVQLPEETHKQDVYLGATRDLRACLQQVSTIPDLATKTGSGAVKK